MKSFLDEWMKSFLDESVLYRDGVAQHRPKAVSSRNTDTADPLALLKDTAQNTSLMAFSTDTDDTTETDNTW